MSTDLQPIVQTAVTAGLIPRIELAWPERAAGLAIINAVTFQLADEERLACKDLIKVAEEKHKPTCDKTYQAWQAALEHRKGELTPLLTAVETFDRNMKAYDYAQRQKAREAQRAIEAAAFASEATEREAVVEHVEQTGGTIGEVKAAIARPMPLPVGPAKVMETAAAPVKPVNSRVVENWKGELTDVWAFVQFALLGPRPPKEVEDWIASHGRRELVALLQPDKVAIGSIARSTKGTMEVPGLRIWDDGKVASLPKKAGA